MDWLATLSREFAPDSAGPYAELRQQALRRVSSRGLPTPRDEAWKYTDLKPFGFILQNEEGCKIWPVTEDKKQKLKKAFRIK